MVFFFAARSVSEIALSIKSLVLSFFAFLIATSSLLVISLLTTAFLVELLKALLAVLVTGMRIV